jgi:Zn-dependent protease with chaperone function
MQRVRINVDIMMVGIIGLVGFLFLLAVFFVFGNEKGWALMYVGIGFSIILLIFLYAVMFPHRRTPFTRR